MVFSSNYSTNSPILCINGFAETETMAALTTALLLYHLDRVPQGTVPCSRWGCRFQPFPAQWQAESQIFVCQVYCSQVLSHLLTLQCLYFSSLNISMSATSLVSTKSPSEIGTSNRVTIRFIRRSKISRTVLWSMSFSLFYILIPRSWDIYTIPAISVGKSKK